MQSSTGPRSVSIDNVQTHQGELRVFLGAAPGVGKTCAMLEAGKALLAQGHTVVVGIVEAHGRTWTEKMASGFKRLPERSVGVGTRWRREMDLDSILASSPEVVLVDNLAHINAPGSRNEQRWQDVRAMLAVGIDVLSTLNVEHIESLHDVVERITRIKQVGTVPDDFLRLASQIELVDLDPQDLRKRLAAGVVYPAERIDAELSNYFRLGNLAALRELTLLWLADDVDQTLAAYREDHRIDESWEARERVVVAITGGRECEALLRRGARIAARSAGGKLLAVHVTNQEGVHAPQKTNLVALRALTEQLGGSYHQVVASDVSAELVEFAKSVNATQLVLGTSRRNPLISALTGGTVSSRVLRKAGSIDVHLVGQARTPSSLKLPYGRGSLSGRRRILGLLVALVGFPVTTWLLYGIRSPESIAVEVLSYQLLVVIVALIGGIWPALLAASLSGLALDYLFIQPYYATSVSDGYHLLALFIYVLVAALVSFVVDGAARKTRIARRAAAESELLQTVAGNVLRGQGAFQALVDRAKEAFSLERVELHSGGALVACSGAPGADGDLTRVELAANHYLEFYGENLSAADQRLLSVITVHLDAIIQQQQLTEAARKLEPIAASDRLRGAILSALSHDLRRPLASATAAVTGLLTAGNALSEADRKELTVTAHESIQALSTLVRDLLDVTRINADAIRPLQVQTDIGAVIIDALDELAVGPSDVEISIGTDLPVLADPVLLQRVIVNLLDNALRYTPVNSPVRIATSSFRSEVEIRVSDHGPGVPEDKYESMFTPFQRAGDTDNTAGLGLGLALSRGFTEAMGGKLNPESTPGGGLTIVITFPTGRESGE